jgi:hypothetical protein
VTQETVRFKQHPPFGCNMQKTTFCKIAKTCAAPRSILHILSIVCDLGAAAPPQGNFFTT